MQHRAADFARWARASRQSLTWEGRIICTGGQPDTRTAAGTFTWSRPGFTWSRPGRWGRTSRRRGAGSAQHRAADLARWARASRQSLTWTGRIICTGGQPDTRAPTGNFTWTRPSRPGRGGRPSRTAFGGAVRPRSGWSLMWHGANAAGTGARHDRGCTRSWCRRPTITVHRCAGWWPELARAASGWAEAALAVAMSPVPASSPMPRPSTVAWRSQ